METNTIMEAALSYAKKGWYVFPCRPNLKIPLTKHGVKDATTDESTIKAWWTRWPDANVALACGQRSGVYVVDVDFEPEKNVDGWESLEDFPEMPMTVRQDSPRGGAHFLFKTNDPPRNKNNFRNGIDIRSEGYYIMLTPSVSVQPCFEEEHPEGIVYEWCPGQGPDDTELAEFPDYFRPEAEKVVMPWEKTTKHVVETTKVVASEPERTEPVEKQCEPSRSVSVNERAALYLSECEPAVQGQGGHDSLLWAARALVTGFKLSRSEAIHLLWHEFNPRCNPPWDQTKMSDIKDFERKVDEAIKTPCSKQDGWLLDSTFDYSKEDIDEKLIELAKQDVAILCADKKPESKPHVSRRVQGVWTEDMFSPPGFVGDLARHIRSTPFGNQPKLAVVSALVAAGALYGRKVKNRRDNRTNLFGLAIGKSSSGKGAAEKVISKLFFDAGISSLISGRVSSDSAIELALETSPVKLFMWDECGEFFKSMKNMNSYAASIPGTLKELWSKADGMYYGKQKIEGHKEVLQNCACLWGAGTPNKVFGDGFDASDIESGLLPRCIVAVCDEDDDEDVSDFSFMPEMPDGLIQITQAWAQRIISGNDDDGDIMSATMPQQMIVRETPEATCAWADYRRKCIGRIKEFEKGGNELGVMWGKAAENAARVSLILACSERYDNPEVTAANMDLACRIIDACTFDVLGMIQENMHVNTIARDRNAILMFITKQGAKGCSKPELARHTAGLTARVRDSYIQELIESEEIDEIDDPKSKSKTRKRKRLYKHPYGLLDSGMYKPSEVE